MAELSIWISEDFDFPAGSGLGFYGDAGFDEPVPIHGFQGRTFVTDPTGQSQGLECNNCKLCVGPAGGWSGVGGVSGVIVGQAGNGIALRNLPNYLATINVRFTHSAPVRAQNAKLYIYDGVTKENDPSGLLCYCAEIIHPSKVQTDLGTGDEAWVQTRGATTLGCIDTPGTSGLRPEGDLTVDTRHDWYIAISCSPTTPADKEFGMCFEHEYI